MQSDPAEQSLDGLTYCLYVARLDYLAPRDSDTIVMILARSRVALGQILLNAPLLCSSALHSRTLSRRRFSLLAVFATL